MMLSCLTSITCLFPAPLGSLEAKLCVVSTDLLHPGLASVCCYCRRKGLSATEIPTLVKTVVEKLFNEDNNKALVSQG